MNNTPSTHPALLPAGLRDVLPPEAELEARSVEAVMDCFASHGYQRVQTPLLEFEDSLFAGAGAAMAEQTFRLMDPGSQRMMGLRADTTPQIARLAATRLANSARPLRLAYAGQCLRVGGTHLQPERQISQVGIELIGHDAAEADAEIIVTAVEALAVVGLTKISVDLTIPRLVPCLIEDLTAADVAVLTRALDRKDAVSVSSFGGPISELLLKLLEASGPAKRALPALLAINLPKPAKIQTLRMAETADAIHRYLPNLALTIDPVEFRGHQYHTGICMTLFAPGTQEELGRGGRYLCGDAEPATGITLYPDTIVHVAPAQTLRPRLYLPPGTPRDLAADYRTQNFATVLGLSAQTDPVQEAIRLGCGFAYVDGMIRPVT